MAEPSPLIEAYLRKRSDLVRFFTLRLGPAGAEDLVQDLYLKLQDTEAPPDLRNPEAFLYRVGSNLMLDRMKAGRRLAARESNWLRETVGEDPDPVSSEPPADEALASRQRLALLMKRLESLPQQTATAFRLHKFEGLSHAETAARMGVSRSSVEKYIMSALRSLMGDEP